MVEICHQQQVFLPGEQIVHGGELPGNANCRPYGMWLSKKIMSRHHDLTGIGGNQRGQDVHGGCLAGPVGA